MLTRNRVLAAAVSFLASVSYPLTPGAIGKTTDAGPATRPAPQAADVPVREVVLFSSGVGYFEHFGPIKGDATTELRFKTDQINDILKSLLLEDMDGGKVGSVSYPGQAPLEHTLHNFQVDIAANPTMGELLNQVRGARLTVSVGASNQITGTILGVERKVRSPANRDEAAETFVLNLKSDRTFRSIPLDQVQSMELEDPKLQKELDDALAALAEARDQDKKPVTIHFRGQGDRRVRIGYVVETPVWKTSYRLMLSDRDPAAKAADPQTGKPRNPKDVKYPAETQSVAGTRPGNAADNFGGGKLQGWAIVENQTDNDWKDVELSLVSGRPLSFIQDLYHAMYIPQPVVQLELAGSLRPQTYSGGITEPKNGVPEFADAPDMSLNSTSNNQPQGGGGVAADEAMAKRAPGGNALFASGTAKERLGPGPIDPTSSIISAASANKVGELFQYTIGSVSLERQKSAMIPIVTDNIDAERLSIYNSEVLADHPLLGARLRNNTKKFLLQGPITVLDHGSYAGDARIGDLPPGQERLISYGIDQQVLVQPGPVKEEDNIVLSSIINGVLQLTTKSQARQTYVMENKSDDARTLIVEHSRHPDWNLIVPKTAEEITATAYRFRRFLDAHQSAQLSVESEAIVEQKIEILPVEPVALSVYMKNVVISKEVRDALAKVIQMKNDMVGMVARIEISKKQIADITAEQARMRENMKSVAASGDYYKRLEKKLNDQESQIENQQKAIADLQHSYEEMQKNMEEYVHTLTVAAK